MLLLAGQKREAIAARLGIHVRTVGLHVAALRHKTRCVSFAALVIALLEHDGAGQAHRAGG